MNLTVETLREGEHLSKIARVEVETALRDREIRIAFHTSDGRNFLTPPITLTDGVGEYTLPSSLLVHGDLLLQANAYGTDFIAKSAVCVKKINKSISANGEQPDDGDLLTLASIDDRVTVLENSAIGAGAATEQYVDDAVAGCVPNERTVNGYALDSDVSLTAADVGAATEQYVNAAVSAAIADVDAALAAMDDVIGGESE